MKNIFKITPAPTVTFELYSIPNHAMPSITELHLVLNPSRENIEVERLHIDTKDPHCVEHMGTALKIMKARVIEHFAPSLETV